jgi:serine protease Do
MLVCSTWLVAAAGLSAAQGSDHPLARGIEKAKRATVGVLEETKSIRGRPAGAQFAVRGSGFHIRDGYIVTARHAAEQEQGGQKVIPQEITVLTTDLHEWPAVLTGVNSFLDIAVYRLNEEGASRQMPPATFADAEPQPGDETFTVGYPLGWGPAVGFGRIGNSNVYLPTVESRLFQVDLSACSGNSGGGLFNADGEVVGVVHAIIQTETIQGEPRCSRFAFAVSGALIRRVVDALIEGTQPAFSKLGIQLTVVKIGTPWRVSVLEAAGPAQEGGIHKGDILLAIEDMPITDGVQLKNYLIERTTPGQRVAVRVLRDEIEQIVYVTLGHS